jgi:hypothetical protein
MALSLMADVWPLDLKSGKKFILLALADSAHDDGSTFFCVDTLAYKTGQCERTVQNHLADLEADGLISKRERPGRSSVFTVNAEAVRGWRRHADWIKRDAMKKKPRAVAMDTPAESAPQQNLHPAKPAPPQELRPAEPAPTPAKSAPAPAESAPSILSLPLSLSREEKIAPPPPPPPGKSPGSQVYEAYAAAYRQRYSVAPLRNAKVNAFAKQIADQVGVETGIKIVGLFLAEGGYYANRAHDLGALITDLQKFAVKAATGEMPQGFTPRKTGPSWAPRSFEPSKADYDKGVGADGSF